MQRSSEEAQRRRPEATARGVDFGEVSFREIVLVDLR
jgi:hypothetical protein